MTYVINTKVCTKCGERKGMDDFYVNARMAGGHLSACKACTIEQVKLRRRTNPAVQAYDRARAKLPERRAHARAVTIRWREENPEAYRAQTAVGNAIRDGKLKKGPCLFCGTERVHAHHTDYSKPLEVKWLCPKCHHRLHANFEASGHDA